MTTNSSLRRMRALFQNKRVQTIVSIEILIVVAIATLILPGGEDLYRFYLPLAQGSIEGAVSPWHTTWIVFPLRFVPGQILWTFWSVCTIAGIYAACRALDTNPILVLLSFPLLAEIWLGQTDIIVLVGLVLASKGKNPYLRGVGLLLASIKPHIAGIAMLLLLIEDDARLKMLVVPVLAALVSFMAWGVDWPLQWLQARPSAEIGLPVWAQASLFPVGLLALLTIPFFPDRRLRLTAALVASSIGVPWFGVYSYIVFLVFLIPWWSVPLSYAWTIAYPLVGNSSVRFAWILPLALMMYMVLNHYERALTRLRQMKVSDSRGNMSQ